jgi:hypothetical protein
VQQHVLSRLTATEVEQLGDLMGKLALEGTPH